MKARAEIAMRDLILARVHAEEKAAILAAATRQGISVSEFLRQATTEAAQRMAA